jgi:hypothetical protein
MKRIAILLLMLLALPALADDAADLRKLDHELVVATPGLEMQAYEPTEVNVRLFGDTAVITGRVEADLRYTDVWIKSSDGWKNVAGHASAISIRKEKAS